MHQGERGHAWEADLPRQRQKPGKNDLVTIGGHTPVDTNPNPGSGENTRQPPRRIRGPSERGKEIIALRNAGCKQVTIAVRLDVSLGAVKQCLRRHRRRAGIIRTLNSANVSFIAEPEGLD
jgi:hypothetical protein